MAETAITAVLSKFGEPALREAAVLLKVGDDIMLLRDRLEWLQAFVRDADRKRRVGADDLTRVWVRQTRDVAFEAEDALDEFVHKVDLESQGYRGWYMWYRYVTGIWTQITIRHGLSGQITRIKSRLDQISENQKEYNLDHTPSRVWTPTTTAHVAWNHQPPVGFYEHKKILEEVKRHCADPQRMFISILGESGVGKETLVRIIRDGTWAKKNFEVSVKYIMPPDSSTEDLLNQVYDRACKEAPGHPEEEGIDIADKLRHLLAKKKYLLILGGISSITILNCMAASLPDDRNGSRVVLILEPESKEVADHADYNLNLSNVNSIHELSRLGESESGFLFGLRVFGAKEKEEEDMETYKKMVYQITGGHPLAIVVLAGLLRSKEKPVEWDAVLQQLQPAGEEEAAQDFELAREKPADNVGLHLHLLRLQQQIMSMSPPAAREPKPKLSNRMAIERIFSSSFDDLPQDIKSCFLYFAAYPKNIAHPANQIVQMWTAEGFIRPHKGKTMEQLGHSYLKELVTRCLVELDAMNTHGGIELVRVHNRLLVFLQSEAREASFIEVHDTIDVLAPASVRRLSIQNDSGSYTTFTTTKFPKLRSFICRVEESKSQGAGPKQKYDLKFLSGSKFLRVLSVQGLNITTLPDEIGDMIHLRYLRVDCPNLMKLPSSIRKLVNLQTLDISETQVKEIDIMFWLIKTLRHVLANRLMLPASIETQQLLDNLQTLHGVTFAEDGRKEAQPSCGFSKKVKPPAQGKREEATGKYYLLDKMTKLRSLEIYGFQHHAAAALESALRKMHLLGHLKLVGDEIPSFVFIEPSLRCLHTMVLDGKINWPTDATTLDVQKARPNLVSLEAQNLPEHENIRTKLERIKQMRTNETR